MTEENLLDVLQYISRERNIPFEMLIEALEAALLTAYKRHFGSEANAIVSVAVSYTHLGAEPIYRECSSPHAYARFPLDYQDRERQRSLQASRLLPVRF